MLNAFPPSLFVTGNNADFAVIQNTKKEVKTAQVFAAKNAQISARKQEKL